VKEFPSPELTWLYTHCRAIGMECKSDSGGLEQDIALFTQLQKEAAKELTDVLELAKSALGPLPRCNSELTTQAYDRIVAALAKHVTLAEEDVTK